MLDCSLIVWISIKPSYGDGKVFIFLADFSPVPRAYSLFVNFNNRGDCGLPTPFMICPHWKFYHFYIQYIFPLEIHLCIDMYLTMGILCTCYYVFLRDAHAIKCVCLSLYSSCMDAWVCSGRQIGQWQVFVKLKKTKQAKSILNTFFAIHTLVFASEKHCKSLSL